VHDEENRIMKIRRETKADIEAITEITKQAFENHAFSQNTEHFIIHALRAANALTVSLVEMVRRIAPYAPTTAASIQEPSHIHIEIGLYPLNTPNRYETGGRSELFRDN
jgi:hypothetical protein